MGGLCLLKIPYLEETDRAGYPTAMGVLTFLSNCRTATRKPLSDCDCGDRNWETAKKEHTQTYLDRE
jgi:hypothetical protein